MTFLDRIPTSVLLFLALMMAGAPFVPEPHLVEKARMLMAGTLTKPLDWFDVVWHLFPAILLFLKLIRPKGPVR